MPIPAGRPSSLIEVVVGGDSELTEIAPGKSRAMCVLHGSAPRHWDLEVDTARSTFRCLVCGERGDAFRYVQRRDRVTRLSAARAVAGLLGEADVGKLLRDDFLGVPTETVGDRIRAAVTVGRALSLTEFSEQFDIARPLLSRWANDSGSPPSEKGLRRIADAADVTVSWLRYGEGNPYGLEHAPAPTPPPAGPPPTTASGTLPEAMHQIRLALDIAGDLWDLVNSPEGYEDLSDDELRTLGDASRVLLHLARRKVIGEGARPRVRRGMSLLEDMVATADELDRAQGGPGIPAAQMPTTRDLIAAALAGMPLVAFDGEDWICTCDHLEGEECEHVRRARASAKEEAGDVPSA